MKAGFAQVDFTPLEGFMPGEGVPFWARGAARCPLFASVAAFAGKRETVILISVDALCLPTPRASELRARIEKATGVPASHILIAATHIHTGAPDYEEFYGTPGDPEVAKYTDDCVVKAATEAFGSMKEGFAIGTGKGIEDRMSFNRDCVMDDGRIVSIPGKAAKEHIVGYLGKVDYDVHVMRVDNAEGEPACFIVNYANHPDNDNTHRTHFSSDFPGYLRENLQRVYGKDTVVLFLNGACGDVNAFNYKSGVSEPYAASGTYMPEEMGKLLAETVFGINKKIKADNVAPDVKARVRTDVFTRRAPTAQETEKALAKKARIDAGERIDSFSRYSAELILSYDEAVPDGIEVETQAVRLGDWTIVTTPGELYTEIGLAVKALAPDKKILISELTNGHVGYICPDSTFDTPAYGAYYYAGRLGRTSDQKVVAAAKALFEELG